MKAILEFNLPDDKDDYTAAMYGKEFFLALYSMDSWLRDSIKYGDMPYESVREKLFEIMEGYGVHLEMLD
jgi:hypothetical protein